MEANKDRIFITYEEFKKTDLKAIVAAVKGKETFFKHLVEYWKKGSYFTYKDERTKPLGKNYAIRINNDGSEDLVKLHFNDDASWLETIKNVTPEVKAPLWKEAIEKGFLSLQESVTFVQKPKDRKVFHKL